jgi:hypothetical protein
VDGAAPTWARAIRPFAARQRSDLSSHQLGPDSISDSGWFPHQGSATSLPLRIAVSGRNHLASPRLGFPPPRPRPKHPLLGPAAATSSLLAASDSPSGRLHSPAPEVIGRTSIPDQSLFSARRSEASVSSRATDDRDVTRGGRWELRGE